MRFLGGLLLFALMLEEAFTFECKCNFDTDCTTFQSVQYLQGSRVSHEWRRWDSSVSGKFTYMYIPMNNNDRYVEAYLRSTTPLRADGVSRCLSFFYKTSSFPSSRLQVQIWSDDLPSSISILFSQPQSQSLAGYWREVSVDIPPYTSGYLVFAGKQDYPGAQVLLDDVVVLEGECFKTRPYPEFPNPVRTTIRYRNTYPPRDGTTRFPRRRPSTTPSIIDEIFFRGGPYFHSDVNGGLWQMNVLNLPPTFTIATAQWTHTGFYPPELGITFNYDQERGDFLHVPVGINSISPPPYTKAYLMTSHQYAADGNDKCLKLDYILYQTAGSLGNLGVYMSPFFLKHDVYNFNGVLERLYKYPREGSHVVNSSPYWRRLEVTIPGSKRGHVFIEATVGSGKGLIAVDDVTVMPGPCPNPALL